MGNKLSLVRNKKRIGNSGNVKNFDTETNHSHSSNNEFYTVPVRFEEFERLKIKHFVIKTVFEENFSAPIKDLLINGCRVLDIGCGPGTWILDLSSVYTQSSFVGLDISLMFPSQIKPNNADFVVADARNELPFESNYFDYIHLGDMGYCFTEYEFDHVVIPECIRILKPGGWFESQETRRFINNSGPCSEKLVSLGEEFLKTLEIKPSAYSQNDLKKNPNMTNIKEYVKQIPLGSWGGKIGEEFAETFLIALPYFVERDTEENYLPFEEMNELINKIPLEISECNSSVDCVRTFGQKKYS
ncbi:hypothetical protein Glove_21g332 [Diversispora epigaea]|uniref:Methyltransferase domain-containing protein n=1 Tax=Diversispora epigaea TaxID=1348612 RepID=A0A397JK72_9GLOM|nr:hypothetical protein Glove_21g332 [Diversispora epigaea]